MSNNQYNSVVNSAKKFVEVFEKFRDKRIVLYGLGQYTATLLNYAKDYYFVGLMDGDEKNIGREIYGLTVLGIDEAKTEADLIVINTSTFYWDLIYDRIKDIGVPVYYANGEKASAKEYIENVISKEEKMLSIDGMKAQIEKSDIVSFDLYDTLIMRLVCHPKDVFELMNLKLQENGINYVEMRNQAIAKLEGDYTIDDIYAKMQELYPMSDTCSMKQLELQTEKALTVIRQDMQELFKYAVELGKEVYILSDMYLTKEYLSQLILDLGININTEHIWISCEKKKNKHDGSMWNYYAKNIVKDKIALHIGDSVNADIILAQKYGINAIKIPSAVSMMEELLSRKTWGEIISIYSSIVVGLAANELFNSPFAWKEIEGKYIIDTCQKCGKVIFGNVILTYLLWMLSECKKRSVDYLIFLSRDGYFLEKDYLHLIHKLGDNTVPEERYLYTSRKAVLALMGVEDKEAYDTLKSFSFNGTFRDYLKVRFNIEAKETDVNSLNKCILPEDMNKVERWIEPYRNEIIESLKVHKERYGNYLKEIKRHPNCAIVDICYKGTIQYWISKSIEKSIKGFYFVADISETNKFYDNDNMIPCFQNDKKAEESQIWKNHKIVESLFTAPYGMMNFMDENGEIVAYETGENQKSFFEREKINDGIKEVVTDFVSLIKRLEIPMESMDIDSITIDSIFGAWFRGNISYSKTLKNCFWHEDGFINGTQEYSLLK